MSKHLESIEFPEIGKYDTDHLARIDGYYEDLTSGTTEQILSNMFIEDNAPYQFRTAGGALEIADRETDMLVGGSIAWNQLANYNSGSGSQGISFSIDGKYLIATGTGNGNGPYILNGGADSVTIYKNHKYLIISNAEDIQDTSQTDIRLQYRKPKESGTGYDYITTSLTQNYSIVTRDNNWMLGPWIMVGQGVVINNFKILFNIIDLTQMFGSTIADYIYSLEQAHAGDGVAWFKRYFPNDYYPYNAGSIESVKASAHKMTGFNQWDEEWELGGINQSNGSDSSSTTTIRTTNYNPILPNTAYYAKCPSTINLRFYDADKNYVGYQNNVANATFTTPSNAYYLRFVYGATTYNHDICINFHWDGERDGEYEEYKEWVYPLDSDLELRGLPKLDTDGNLVYDGDTYEHDGTVTRRYGIVDLGTLTWAYNTGSGVSPYFYTNISDLARIGTPSTDLPKFICSKYLATKRTSANFVDKCITQDWNGTVSQVQIKDLDFTDTAAFKNALNGVYLVYELTTPTTETADAFTNPQIVDNWGTEEYITTTVVPVGHFTKYPPDLKAKLEVAPESPDADGMYLMHRESGQNSYSPYIPQDISGKANIDGYYEDMTVGLAENLVTNLTDTESEPFTFRTSGGNLEIGDREELKVVGGSVVWNQLINTLPATQTISGITFTNNGDGSISVSGTATERAILTVLPSQSRPLHKYLLTGCPSGGSLTTYSLAMRGQGGDSMDFGNGVIWDATNNPYKGVVIYVISGATITTPVKFIPQFIDLTQMFGTTIADYIYNLEQTTAGAGVAFFKKYFPKDYYPYNTGEMLHVQTSEFKTVGFNQWDEEWEVGGIVNATGATFSTSDRIRAKNYNACLSNTTYYFKAPSQYLVVYWYDADKNYIGYEGVSNITKASPSNARFFKIVLGNGVTTYGHDICINLHWDGTRDGEYEPYTEHSYPLDDSLTLRGIPKLDADNNLYYDGDTYEHDGTVTRKYGIVDLGTLTWTKATYGSDTVFQATISSAKNSLSLCSKYYLYSSYSIGSSRPDKTINAGVPYFSSSHNVVTVKDSAYSDATAFKTAMSGVYFIYELETSTTEEADPYQTPQIVDNWGTEEFVVPTQSGVEIPVGHETIYPISLRDKLESSPNLPDGDGDYIMRMNNGEASYVKLASQFPAPPTENGNYVLKATVTNGTATLSWEAQS